MTMAMTTSPGPHSALRELAWATLTDKSPHFTPDTIVDHQIHCDPAVFLPASRTSSNDVSHPSPATHVRSLRRDVRELPGHRTDANRRRGGDEPGAGSLSFLLFRYEGWPSSLPAKPMHGKLGRAGSLGPAPARTAQIIRCAKSLLSPAPRSPSSLPGLLHSFPCRPRILAQPRPVPSLHPYPSSCGAALCQAAQPGPGPLVLARDSAGGLLLRPCASCAQGLGSGTHPGTNLPGADHTHGGRRVSESTRLCQWRCAETSETASRTVSVRVLGVRVPRPRSSVRRRAAARGRAGLQASRCSGACRLACCALLSSILCACEV